MSGKRAKSLELLAPAGGMDSVLAAVRCGADAVYVGGKKLSARAGASNFDKTQLLEAVSYCHVRGGKVYQAVNTLVFDQEVEEAERQIQEAWETGVDALIVQDPAVALLAREIAPRLPLHASTQMSVHNLDGVRQMEQMGFERVVLARELGRGELEYIAARTPLELECFVHGALCMCVSGQCYLSSMIGGRSGNRGQCAQPCRLPFAQGDCSHALSLRDLSLVKHVRELEEMGIASLKIEGRLKRPEYVAAAVTAYRKALDGEQPDLDALEAVFSRSGFTAGYYEEALGPEMFGTRQREDVAASGGVLGELAALYREERQRIPVDMVMLVEKDLPTILVALDDDDHRVQVEGAVPQIAKTTPITEERAAAALGKMGGTPYLLRRLKTQMDEDVMLPVADINALRRDALERLTEERQAANRGPCASHAAARIIPYASPGQPQIRIRLEWKEQLTRRLLDQAEKLILPLEQLLAMDGGMLRIGREKLVAELPQLSFGTEEVSRQLRQARELGIGAALAGNPGGVYLARGMKFAVHGDFGLNCTNTLALEEWDRMGLADLTLSFEITADRAAALGGRLPRGIVAYGRLPLMLTRNAPGGKPINLEGWLTDRKGNKFRVSPGPGKRYYQLQNCVPLYLADKQEDFTYLDFLTLYFTGESPQECLEVLRQYREKIPLREGLPKTRGLYYRKVL